MLKLNADQISQTIFRAYDIRGEVPNELNEDIVHDIGMAFGSEAKAQNQDTVVVGRDGRLSGEKLMAALHAGLTATGCDVIDIGIVPTPVLYYAAQKLTSGTGIMMTGSHNPVQYNGLKMMLAGHTLTMDAITNLYDRIVNQNVVSGLGQVSKKDMYDQYFTEIQQNIKLDRPLKVVVDAANGVGGLTAPAIYRALGCDVVEMYCDVDGTFPNHHPDPSKPENLLPIIDMIRKVGADIGLAFDGDGDRVGVVTPSGEVIFPDRQLMLYAKAVLEENPGAQIVYDVKCSKNMAPYIKQYGGDPIMYKTGHSLMKAKMKALNAPLAGELSGHIFFNDRWYGFDDAAYVGARLLEIMSKEDRDLDQIFADVPKSISTPELHVKVQDDHYKFELMQKLVDQANFKDANVITIDGLRVEFEDCWGLMRASNTTPIIVLRFEADNEAALEKIQYIFREFLLEVDRSLDLPY